MNEAARTLLETAIVGALALGGGLVANALSPEGLSLTRDHFRTATPLSSGTIAPAPQGGVPAGAGADGAAARAVGGAAVGAATEGSTAGTETAGTGGAAGTAAAGGGAAGTEAADGGGAASTPADDAASAAVAERLRQHGLQVVTHAEALALFEDPAYTAGAYVFVDARGDDAYRAGHVPGAVQFDRYRPERHIEAVQAACAGALKVIVYCIGVDCEDSELAAQDLPALGIDPRAVHVYVGGWTAWSAAGLPVETGARGGGDG